MNETQQNRPGGEAGGAAPNRLLAFNLVMTAYLVLGSLNAEAHMLRFYGDAYRGYQ